LADLDRAVALDGSRWELYFVRSFVRMKMLASGERGEGLPAEGAALVSGLDYGLVKSDLDKVVELEPGFAFAYFNRAGVCAKMDDYKSAIVDYTAAINIDGDFAEAYYNRGLARIYTGNADAGVGDLSRAGELGLFKAYSVIKRFK
jgi:tetratricopeptide (TPR) repeat protein